MSRRRRVAAATALAGMALTGCGDDSDASCGFTSQVVLDGIDGTAETEVVLVNGGNQLDGLLDFNGHLYAIAPDRDQSYPDGPGRYAGTATQLDDEGERITVDLGDDGRLELQAVHCD